jgi:cytochrome oxidase Cu insertion factor (SCO1/SenC/PrrC family)
MQSNNVLQKKSNRKNLVLLFVVFALPALVATLMYLTGWRPASSGNFGELIQPARFIEDRVLQSIDAKPVKLSDLHGKWTMVYFDTSACAEECMKQIYLMRQTHIAQGRDQERLQRVFIITDAKEAKALKAKLTDYPEMLVWTAEKPVLAKLMQEFGIDGQTSTGQQNIYLLDPIGNLMMRYVPGIDPAGIRKDLVRLLKYSSEKK